MASGVELASAYVQLLPSMRGFARDAQRQMGPIGARIGAQFGDDFGRQFQRASDGTIRDMQGRFVRESDIAGGASGNAYGDAFGDAAQVDASNTGRDLGKKVGLAAAVAIGAAVGASIKGAADQEVDKDRLAAAIGATPKEQRRLGNLAGKIYAEAYGESFADVTGALESVRGSFRELGTGKSLEEATKQALDFSKIFNIDLPRAVQVAQTAVRSGFAKDGTQALNLFTKALQNVAVPLQEPVLDAVEEYGQFFRTIGLEGPQAMELLVKAADKGTFGVDKIGDAIKEFTIRATDGSTGTVDAFKAIGVAPDEAANSIIAGGEKSRKALNQIVDGLLAIKDPAKQSQQAIALFGTPLEDLNATEVPAFLKSLRSSEKGLKGYKGAIKDAGAVLNDNASTNIEQFKRTITQTFVDLIGGRVIPLLQDFSVDVRERLVSGFARVRDIAEKFRPAFEKVVGLIRDNPDFVKAFGVALGALVGGITAVTVATTAFSIALNSTGIPLVVIGIAALAAGLVVAYKRSETFREIVNEVGATAKEFGIFLRDTVLPALVSLGREVAAKLKPTLDQLGETFRTRIAPALQAAIVKFREALPAIRQVAQFIGRVTAQFVRMNATVLGKVLPPMIRLAGFILGKAIPAFAEMIGIFARATAGMIRVGGAFVSAGRSVARFTSDSIANVGNFVSKVVDGIESIPEKVRGLFGKMYNAGRDMIGKLFEGIRSAAGGAGGVVANIALSVKNALRDAINGLIGEMNNAIPDKIGKGRLSINLPNNPIPELYKGTRNFSGGLALVGEQGPELVTMPRGTRVDTAAATRRMISPLAAAGSSMPSRMVLRIGDRDFIGYVSAIADDRVASATDLANEARRAGAGAPAW